MAGTCSFPSPFSCPLVPLFLIVISIQHPTSNSWHILIYGYIQIYFLLWAPSAKTSNSTPFLLGLSVAFSGQNLKFPQTAFITGSNLSWKHSFLHGPIPNSIFLFLLPTVVIVTISEDNVPCMSIQPVRLWKKTVPAPGKDLLGIFPFSELACQGHSENTSMPRKSQQDAQARTWSGQ